MNENHKIIIILVSVPVVALLIMYMISGVKFSPSFSAEEQKVFNFSDEQTPQFAHRKQLPVIRIKSPISLSQNAERGFPKTSLVEMSPPPDATGKRVSFILLHKKRNLAIVDGKLVHEGDLLGNQKIAKIEKDKILLKGREGEKWLNLD
ncbi:MAG TPA: hypothetical protein DDY17_06845 [Syntrophaceae bacterium]|nr:hypothetical protein [Syntrophaceae bacterium]